MNAEVSSFQLTTGSLSDVRLDAVTLTQGGSLASNKLVNCSLFRGTNQIATSSGFSGDSLTFALGTPYVVAVGRTRTFYVHCDIEGGRMIDTIRLYLHQAGDLDVTDIAQEQPARVVNHLTLEDVMPLTLRGPTVTVVDNGPVSSLVLPGTVNVKMQDLGLAASHDVTVRDTRIVVRVYDASGQPVGTTDESVYDLLRNLRMVDLDTGSILLGPLTMVSSGDRVEQTGEVWYSKVHTGDYDLIGGETRHLSIHLDVENGFPAGYSIMVEYWLTPEVGVESYIKYMPSNEFLPASNITGNPVFSRRVVVSDYPSLNVTRAAAPVSTSTAKGATNIPVLGAYLSAGTDDITANRLIVRFYGNDSATWDTVRGNLAANTIVASATLYDGADVLAGPEALSLADVIGSNGIYDAGDYYRAIFDDLALTVSASTTKTLTAKVNLLNTMSTTVYLAADIVPDEDIIAWDSGANTVVPSGVALNGGLPHDVVITVLTHGSFTAVGGGGLLDGVVVAGAQDLVIRGVNLVADYEGFTVTRLTIVNDLVGDFGSQITDAPAIEQVTITYSDINGVYQSRSASMSMGQVTFSGLDYYIPTEPGVIPALSIKVDIADMTSFGESLSGQQFRLPLRRSATFHQRSSTILPQWVGLASW
jgi:hypothetical protein